MVEALERFEMLRKPVSSFSRGAASRSWAGVCCCARCLGTVRGEVCGPLAPCVEGLSLSREMRCEVGGAATTLLGGFSGPSLLFIATVPELEKSIGARFCGTGVAYGLPVRWPPCAWPLRLRMRCFAGPPVPVKG